MIGKYSTVHADGGFIELDLPMFDGGGFELLGHALFYIARGLADLEKPDMRRICY